MTNAELIDLFRNVERSNHPVCNGCPMKYTCDENQITRCLFGTAADALEAAENRIEELEAQLPKEGEWIVDKNGYPQIICSICDVHIPMVAGWCMDAHIKYCPDCGAKMNMKKGKQE